MLAKLPKGTKQIEKTLLFGKIIACRPCTFNERIVILFYILDKKIEEIEKNNKLEDIKMARDLLIYINNLLRELLKNK